MSKIPVVLVVGYSDSGKTRCMTGLIFTLTRRGYRVASAKHCHDGFTSDVAGKDSWQHKQAGAVISLMSNHHQVGAVITTATPLRLAEICARYVYDADILLAEGYTTEPFPKILVLSQKRLADERVRPGDNVIALVSDKQADSLIPQFTFNDLELLADLLERHYLSAQRIDQQEAP